MHPCPPSLRKWWRDSFPGLLDNIKSSLDKADIDYMPEFGGVVFIQGYLSFIKASNLQKSKGVDFILAVGGGSVMVCRGDSHGTAAGDFDVMGLI